VHHAPPRAEKSKGCFKGEFLHQSNAHSGFCKRDELLDFKHENRAGSILIKCQKGPTGCLFQG
jgi:hypothetical protein